MNAEQKSPSLIIFTDLDGSLLDYDSYSYKPALSALQKINQLNIPVIAASSKTQAELIHFRQEINNSHPFIVENGAAIFLPVDYFCHQAEDTELLAGFWVKKFVQSRSYWQSLIARTTASREKFSTFSDLSVSDLVRLTALDYDSASRAAQRQYGEPVCWHGSEDEKQEFISELNALGANVLHGGRFLHVSGQCNKGIALEWLTQQYKNSEQQAVTTLAIGDSHNDIAMLEAADIAILIPSPAHPLPKLKRTKNLYTASYQGPKGWADSVSSILQSLNLS